MLTDLQKKGLEDFEREFNERISRVLSKSQQISEPVRKAREFVKIKFERERIKNFYANDIIPLRSYFKIKKNVRKKIKPKMMRFKGFRYKIIVNNK